MDPISNLLCALRNGSLAQKTYVSVPYSKVVWQIGHVLHVHGYIYGMGIQKHASFSRIVLPFYHKSIKMVQSNLHVFLRQKNVCICLSIISKQLCIVFTSVSFLHKKGLWLTEMLSKQTLVVKLSVYVHNMN